ncbi:deoxyribose-phosphate aldolase [Tetragenococcus solitarius]|uniref:Deoxyribose-phosphate aldolase n=1 Tax=Tetragenococcus solitarius TaxID=71453 RepID=A0ABN3Y0S3_9ENTE|nr:deoxyribose-phosphate aldolase [Tetragenococcus solitarius]
MEFTIDELSRMIDHTNLHADATKDDIKKLCDEAKELHFKMVAINQVQTALCADLLANTDIGIGAAIGFPLGQTTIEAKEFETKNAIENGATEIDYVINITEVKERNWKYIEKEMQTIVEICQRNSVISKVIFENVYLNEDEKIQLCKIAKKVQPDFVKTATGFASGGATYEDVQLMKENAGDIVKVKAAGGIRDAKTFKEMIAAGAERIGASSGIKIIEELKNEMKENNSKVITIE